MRSDAAALKRRIGWTLAVASAAFVSAGPACASAAARTPSRGASGVSISPEPGTPDASPQTQISILGVRRPRIRSVRVIGLESGLHAGRLHAYSGNQGASYVLNKPLAQGERVKVSVAIAGLRRISLHFTVAHLAAIPGPLNSDELQLGKLDRFVSQPTLLPPKIKITRPAKLHGDIFLTPLPAPMIHPESNNELTFQPVGPGGPMIIAPNGRLIWFDQVLPPAVAANFRPQRYHGHEVLTWWQGTVTPTAYGQGEGVIADTRYRTVRIVRAGNGYRADLHEFLLTRAGDALFTVYSPILVHLPGTPAGRLSPLLDSIVQEVDVRTGLVVWEWHAYGHIPLSDSYASSSNSSSNDAYHLNSIQALPHDRVLVSARDTSAVYEIDQATGHILWTLGGKASSFRLGRGVRFNFQHDARLEPGNDVSVFDDEAGPPILGPYSRGLLLHLNLRRHTARLVHQYHRPGAATIASSEGSTQLLAGGRVLVGFGATPFFSEFSAAGRLLFDGRLPTDDGSYRAFVFPWQTTPRARPVAVSRRLSSTAAAIYVSWNGATTVARWVVLAGGRRLATAADRSFETRIVVQSAASSFTVRALDKRGRVLASTHATP